MPKKKPTRRLPRVHKRGAAAKNEPAAWTLDQVHEGQTYRFQTTLSDADVDSFASLTCDMNYIHLKKSSLESAGLTIA
jgi:acyl dehydratase